MGDFPGWGVERLGDALVVRNELGEVMDRVSLRNVDGWRSHQDTTMSWVRAAGNVIVGYVLCGERRPATPLPPTLWEHLEEFP